MTFIAEKKETCSQSPPPESAVTRLFLWVAKAIPPLSAFITVAGLIVIALTVERPNSSTNSTIASSAQVPPTTGRNAGTSVNSKLSHVTFAHLEPIRLPARQAPARLLSFACARLLVHLKHRAGIRVSFEEKEPTHCMYSVNLATNDGGTHVPGELAGTVFIQLRANGGGLIHFLRVKLSVTDQSAENRIYAQLSTILDDITQAIAVTLPENLSPKIKLKQDFEENYRGIAISFAKERIGEERYNLIARFPKPDDVQDSSKDPG